MSAKIYAAATGTRRAEVTRKIDPAQVKNDAGGFVYEVDEFEQLRRFLILGAVGGTFYVNQDVTMRSALGVVDACLSSGPVRAIAMATDISAAGRARSNDPAIFVIARALACDDEFARRLAADAVPHVCRTFTHLTSLIVMMREFRGWGALAKRAVASWYQTMTPDRLAYQAVKYGTRQGWSHRDVLRVSHPKAEGEDLNRVLRWLARGEFDDALPPIAHGAARVQDAETSEEVVALVDEFRLPWEAVPTRWRKDVEVRSALLRKMPLWAMIRQLGLLTSLGVLSPGSDDTHYVADRLRSSDEVRRSRVHPMAVLQAMQTYASGRGVRSSWVPVRQISDALDDAFYGSFGNVSSTGKRILLAVDTSGSMGATVPGMGISACRAAAAMLMITDRAEPKADLVGFNTGHEFLDISHRRRIDDVMRAISPGGGTNTAIPFGVALARGVAYDAIVVITDSETWAGQHPRNLLREFRARVSPGCKVVWAMTTGRGWAGLPTDDPQVLNVVGFDARTPQLISEFIGGASDEG